MADKTLNVKIKEAYDTEANQKTNNPVLLKGQLAISSDVGKAKVGNGTSTWQQLSYMNAQNAIKATQDASGNVITSTYATKTELSKKSDSGHTHDDRYYTESEINSKLSGDSKNPISLTSKDLNTITSYGQYYGGGGNKCTNGPSGVDAFGLQVLRTASGWIKQILHDNSTGKIYYRFFNSTQSAQKSDYNEDNKPTKSDVGLSNVDNTSDKNKPISSATQTALNNKVDKISGKGLSTNDFTTAYKTKLDGIETGAQKNTVTGVKGNSESSYRTGNINLTPDNIGALSKAGSIMDRTAQIQWGNSEDQTANRADQTYPVKLGGLYQNEQSDSIKLYGEETSRDNLDLVLQFGDDNSNKLSIRNAKGSQTAYITANGEIGGSFKGNLSGNVTGSLFGNASTASKLATARNIKLTGVVTGNANFDGSSDISIGTFISDRSVMPGKIAIKDFYNYAELNENTAAAYGFSSTVDTSGTIYSYNPCRDKFISNYHTCNGGEVFRIKGQISTNCQGVEGSNAKAYVGTAIGIYCYSKEGTSVSIVYSTRVTATSDAPWKDITSKVTLPANARSFRVFVQTSASNSFSGTIKVRNINVTKVEEEATSAQKWSTARSFTIKDASSTNAGTSASVNGTGNVNLLLPSTIKANLTGHASSDLALSGGTMTGAITLKTGNQQGIKLGSSHLSAANSTNGEQVFQGGHLRFGSSDQDYSKWAGLKYDHASKSISLGLADGSTFSANSSPQSGGIILTPGVSSIHIGSKADANTVLHTGNYLNYTLPINSGEGIKSIGGNGKYSYAIIATLKQISSYANHPVSFEISGRGIPYSEVEIMLTSANNTDSGLNYFKTNDYTEFQIKKTDTSTWEIYVKYSEPQGNVKIHRIKGEGLNSYLTVKLDMANIDALPDGCTKATYKDNARYASNANNADTTDNYHASTSPTKNTIVVRDNNNYAQFNYINTNIGVDGANSSAGVTSGSKFLYTNSDNQIRKSNKAEYVKALGVLPTTGGTLTGQLKINGAAGDKPLMVRGIVGSDGNGNEGELHLNYGIDAPIKIGKEAKTYFDSAGILHGNVSGSLSGNASTATKLGTARTINGTSFDGSANITTSNWGTARNITIIDNSGDHSGAVTSVDGSKAYTLKMPETIKGSFIGNLTGNADTATKATQDASGNIITNTYVKKGSSINAPVVQTYAIGSNNFLLTANGCKLAYNGTATGYLMITPPVHFQNTMMRFKVSIYVDGENSIAEYIISGMSTSIKTQANCGAYSVGKSNYSILPVVFSTNNQPNSKLTVDLMEGTSYLANDSGIALQTTTIGTKYGTQGYVSIGNANTTQNNPIIVISDIMVNGTKADFSSQYTGQNIKFTTTQNTDIVKTIDHSRIFSDGIVTDNSITIGNMFNDFSIIAQTKSPSKTENISNQGPNDILITAPHSISFSDYQGYDDNYQHPYKGKTAVAINCRTGLISAHGMWSYAIGTEEINSGVQNSKNNIYLYTNDTYTGIFSKKAGNVIQIANSNNVANHIGQQNGTTDDHGTENSQDTQIPVYSNGKLQHRVSQNIRMSLSGTTLNITA